MGRTCILAVNDLVKVIDIFDICRFQESLLILRWYELFRIGFLVEINCTPDGAQRFKGGADNLISVMVMFVG